MPESSIHPDPSSVIHSVLSSATPVATQRPATLISGDSEMTKRVRDYDWTATPLGPIGDWSETLTATVNLMLHSPFPTILSWGAEMVFLYNDASIPTLMGKHPQALGGRYREVFDEAWNLVGADLEACLLRGETPVRDNMFIPILLNGVIEDHFWNYSLIPVYENGTIRGIYDAYRNMTEVVMGARRLRDSEARLKMATEVAKLGVFVWHINEDRASWENERMFEIFGRKPEDGPINISMFLGEVVEAEFREAFQQAMESTLKRGESFHFEGIIRRKDGASNWIEITGQPEFEDDGSPVRILGTIRDTTHMKKSEQALRTAEKLSVVGRLASSIAHEINNPLEAVTNLLFLARQNAAHPLLQEYLDLAERELRRVSVIANQTLRFYRQTTSSKEAIGAELMESVLSIHQGRLINANVEVQRRMRSNMPVNCFEGEIRQVLNNLVSNAVDAMQPDGGRLLVRSRQSTFWKDDRKGITLTVADTGDGIIPEVMARMFEPFFTTKGIHGTGLGLWISEDIVKRHRGELRVRSRPRAGSVFSLFLPFDGVDLKERG